MGCANSKSQRRKKARGLRVDEDDDDIAAETAYKARDSGQVCLRQTVSDMSSWSVLQVVIIGSRAVGKSWYARSTVA